MKMLYETLIRLLLTGLLIYVLLVAVVYLAQRQMLYLSGMQNLSADQVSSLGLKYWPEAGAGYRGFVSQTDLNNPLGSVIVFQGNAGAAWDRYFYIQALEPLGYRVVLAEYPGYGLRQGEHSEQSFVEDAQLTIQKVYKDFGGPVVLWGESLGAGVVSSVVADGDLPISAIVLATPWDSLPELAQRHYPYLPARWLVKDRYDNINNLRTFKGTVAVLVAGEDQVIPKEHGLRLYSSLKSRKRLWQFEHAGHNSIPISPAEKWWGAVMTFIHTSD